jgi:hypothetical protein
MYNSMRPFIKNMMIYALPASLGGGLISINLYKDYLEYQSKKEDDEKIIKLKKNTMYELIGDSDKSDMTFTNKIEIFNLLKIYPEKIYDIFEYYYENNKFTKLSFKILYDVLHKITPNECVFLNKHKNSSEELCFGVDIDLDEFDECERLGICETKKFSHYFSQKHYRELFAGLICKYCCSDIDDLGHVYTNKKLIIFDKYLKIVKKNDNKKAEKLAMDCLIESIACGNTIMYDHITKECTSLLIDNYYNKISFYKKLIDAYTHACNLSFKRKWTTKSCSTDDFVKIGKKIYNAIELSYGMRTEGDRIAIDNKKNIIDLTQMYIVKNPVLISSIDTYIEMTEMFDTILYHVYGKHNKIETTDYQTQLSNKYLELLQLMIKYNNYFSFNQIISKKIKFKEEAIELMYDYILRSKLEDKLTYLNDLVKNGYRVPAKYKEITPENKNIINRLVRDYNFTEIKKFLSDNGFAV